MATLSQNITQAISDFDSIKTAIQAKGVTVASGTPTSEYGELIEDIPTGDDNFIKAFVQRTITSIDIPQGTTTIGKGAFFSCTNLTSVTIPDSVTSIGQSAFQNAALISVTIPAGVTSLGISAFSTCTSLTNLTFNGREGTAFSQNVFYNCNNLANVTFPNGFNWSGLDLSASRLYSADTIVGWLNALADLTGNTAKTLTIGSANLAKLTAEQIAIATNKNWNLA